jgi:hypothetical protein
MKVICNRSKECPDAKMCTHSNPHRHWDICEIQECYLENGSECDCKCEEVKADED